MYSGSDHAFVICAYKENEHLEETIRSLIEQTIESKILVSTSTPNSHIEALCQKYGLDLIINEQSSGPGSDWNYAYDHAKADLITIAHQDDIYNSNYLEKILASLNIEENVLFAYSGYYEIRNEKHVYSNLLLNIKKIMNYGFSLRCLNQVQWFKKLVLSLGDPICCPSVTFVTKNVGQSPFDENYINSCDYKTWVDLATLDGRFLYIRDALVGHRIYSGSATTKNLSDNIRKKEDLEILSCLLPRPVAYIINHFYSLSEKSNEI